MLDLSDDEKEEEESDTLYDEWIVLSIDCVGLSEAEGGVRGAGCTENTGAEYTKHTWALYQPEIPHCEAPCGAIRSFKPNLRTLVPIVISEPPSPTDFVTSTSRVIGFCHYEAFSRRSRSISTPTAQRTKLKLSTMALRREETLQLRAALQEAIVRCSERCLYQSAKWYRKCRLVLVICRCSPNAIYTGRQNF